MKRKKVKRGGFHRAETSRMSRDQAMLKRKKERIELLKRRRRAFFALAAAVLGAFLLLIVFLAGGFDKKATETTLTVMSDGSIIFEEVDVVDSEVSQKEIEAYAQKEIRSYNERTGEKNAVHLKKCSVSDGVAYIKTRYSDAKSYSDFTGLNFFSGTVEEAQKEGYGFQTVFVKAASGKKTDSVERDEVLKNKSDNIVIADQAITIAVPADIKCVSDEGTVMEGTKAVHIGDPVESYIVY